LLTPKPREPKLQIRSIFVEIAFSPLGGPSP
jgi:hypothetical protein